MLECFNLFWLLAIDSFFANLSQQFASMNNMDTTKCQHFRNKENINTKFKFFTSLIKIRSTLFIDTREEDSWDVFE